MAKKKPADEHVSPEEHANVADTAEVQVQTDHSRTQLEARRDFLLNLLETLKSERFNSIGDVEVSLSRINRDLAILKN